MKRDIPGSIKNRSGDFFCPDLQLEGGLMKYEDRVFVKATLLRIKDWDGFQHAMRRGLLPMTSKKNDIINGVIGK